VGRPGLEPGTYGLKEHGTFDDFQELAPVPHQSPTNVAQETHPAALAAELLEAQQAGDPRWVDLAERLAAVARPDSVAARGHDVARLATELAAQVLQLAAEQAERDGTR